MIAANIPAIPTVLTQLDLPVHTLGFCWLLAAKSESVPNEETDWFISTAIKFLQESEASCLSSCALQFSKICQNLAMASITSGRTKSAIAPLRAAIGKFRPSPDSLTPVHASFLQVCLKAKMYHVAKPVVEQRIIEVDAKATGLLPRDVLLFFLYSGRVQIGLKNFPAAQHCFQQALTMPCTCVNAIMVEAYKKYVLVSLLACGSLPLLPKYTSQLVQRHVKNLCAKYESLATVYATHSSSDFAQAIEESLELLRADGNEGLAKQCLQSLSTGNIARLTQTYVTLSLEDIAVSAQLQNAEEAEMKVLDMIARGQIFARINQADGMVSFLENPEEYNTNTMMTHLDHRISASSKLFQLLSTQNNQLGCDPEYISKTLDRRATSHGIDEGIAAGGANLGMF